MANRSSHSAFFPRPAFRSPKASEKRGAPTIAGARGPLLATKSLAHRTQDRWSHKILFYALSLRHSSLLAGMGPMQSDLRGTTWRTQGECKQKLIYRTGNLSNSSPSFFSTICSRRV